MQNWSDIPTHVFYSVSDSFDKDPDPILQGSDEQTEKNFSKKNKIKFWIKNHNLLIPRPTERDVQATEL